MPLVNVMVNSRAYTIACDEGEEDHLKQLAAYVDGKVRELMESVGQVGDARLLLMAALLLADECFEAQSQVEAHGKRVGEAANDHVQPDSFVAERLEAAAKQLEDIAARFAHA
jgi:cell division protein ZapA